MGAVLGISMCIFKFQVFEGAESEAWVDEGAGSGSAQPTRITEMITKQVTKNTNDFFNLSNLSDISRSKPSNNLINCGLSKVKVS